MAIPEGFTRTQLGLPEDDNRRTIERPTTGLWHVLIEHNAAAGSFPATIFESQDTGRTSIHVCGFFCGGPATARLEFGVLEILEAPDEAIDALRRAGYEFFDRRNPA